MTVYNLFLNIQAMTDKEMLYVPLFNKKPEENLRDAGAVSYHGIQEKTDN